MSHTLRLLLSLALTGPTAAAVAGAQGEVDPFAGGLRWAHGPDSTETWMPRDVAFAAGGELVWAAPAVGTPHLALYAAGAISDPAAPVLRGPDLPGAIGVIPVAVGADAGELFAATQFPDPSASERVTEIVRYDAFAAGLGAPFGPVWTYSPPLKTNGPALLAADAAGGLVYALRDDAAGAVRIEWLDPADGQPLAQTTVAGGALKAFAASEGGARVALTAGLELWLVDAAGQALHHETLAASTSCLALAGDGRTLLVGGFGAARVLSEEPDGTFATTATYAAAPNEIAARAAVSFDARTRAIGWWDYTNTVDVRFESFDGETGALLHSLEQKGALGGLQNFTQSVEVSADGERVALGLWGLGGADTEPDVLLFERGTASPVQAWHLPGSVLAMDLDASATRLAVAMKDSHANQFASTGRVRLYDTGERDLQVTAATQAGGTLEAAFLLDGATLAAFGVGTPVVGQPVFGVGGLLMLEQGQPLVTLPATPDASGRADLSVPVPAGLVGASLGLQAVGWSAGSAQFSACLVRPAIL